MSSSRVASCAQTLASAQMLDSVSLAEDHYFGGNPPPKDLDKHRTQARIFVDHHAAQGNRVVLITSGGTTVPLEKQTVRFIDNFSAGSRGAISAEFFLEAGYAVVFLHRQFSLQPYSRHYSHATESVLDFLDVDGHNGRETVTARPDCAANMLAVLRRYRAARDRNMLLVLPFVTITDYLWELRVVAELMRPLGPNSLLYLAAAVSDFFLPSDRMSEHKIQSTDAAAKTVTATTTNNQDDDETFDNFDSSPAVPRAKRLTIDLEPVPKFLKNLVDGWAPEGMIVSFKLETDPTILVHKARYSLERYQHHLVIGNLLTTRKFEVVFVSPGRRYRWIRVPRKRRLSATVATREGRGSSLFLEMSSGTTVGASQDGDDRPLDPGDLADVEPAEEIESLIVAAVKELHTEHVRALKVRRGPERR